MEMSKHIKVSIRMGQTSHYIVAGVMRGQEYDERAATSINIHKAYGINPRDRPSTYNHRALRSVSRHGK